jgi:hypothetical protein
MFFTAVHTPVPDAHAVQAFVHDDCAQQKPSLHTPVVHCALSVHAPPGDVSTTHPPPALQ